jgi:hypothetical protein
MTQDERIQHKQEQKHKKNQKQQKQHKQKNIPIYGVNRSSIYQIAKLIQFIML